MKEFAFLEEITARLLDESGDYVTITMSRAHRHYLLGLLLEESRRVTTLAEHDLQASTSAELLGIPRP